jgi:inositol transport system substrate-binding protein
MQAGDLDVTVFQDAAVRARARWMPPSSWRQGEPVDQKVYIPFQLVTPANVADYLAKN